MKIIKKTWKIFCERARQFFDSQLKPDVELLVSAIVMNCANMEMENGQFVEFSPAKGSCGPIRLSGNCRPVFSYLMFDKTLMEFVRITVEMSAPSRIYFQSRIESNDSKMNGKEIEVSEKFKEPFYSLAYNLYRWFPLWQKPGVKNVII